MKTASRFTCPRITFSFLVLNFIFGWNQTSLASGAVTIKPAALSTESENCRDCHLAKQQNYILSKSSTVLKHADKAGFHGKAELACGACHDRNNFNLLRSSAEAPASFDNPSAVCQQCHQDKFRDWQSGIHGKRLGGWHLNKTQLQCTECHSAHSVKFKKMPADPPPRRPKLGIKRTQ